MKYSALALVGLICGCAGPAAMPQPGTAPDVAIARQAIAPCRRPAPNAPVPTAVHGLMVWIDSIDETEHQPDILQYLPNDPNLCGASIVVLWSRIDRGPNIIPQYDFKPIERAIRPWSKAGKLVNLLFTGTNEVGPADTATPAWVLAQTGANTVDVVPCPDPGGNGSVGPPTPVYWEQGYSTPWRAFIRAVIAKFAHDPRIGYMRFGLGAGAEDFPQHGADANCFAAWQAYGLSAKFWTDYSASLVRKIAAYSKAYDSHVQQMVALNPFSDPAAPYDVSLRVAQAAAANGVGFGTENLGSGNYGSVVEACTPQQYWCGAFDKYAGKVPLEFQPINFTLQPGTHIAPLPELLPYALYNHAQIFELYPQEWLTADDPSYSTYAANHVAWKKALTDAAATLGP
jgi:hypothetical protein